MSGADLGGWDETSRVPKQSQASHGILVVYQKRGKTVHCRMRQGGASGGRGGFKHSSPLQTLVSSSFLLFPNKCKKSYTPYTGILSLRVTRGREAGLVGSGGDGVAPCAPGWASLYRILFLIRRSSSTLVTGPPAVLCGGWVVCCG